MEVIMEYSKAARAGHLFSAVISIIAMCCLTACETKQERIREKEDALAAAGFTVRAANTPERQAMLDRLPPHRFIRCAHDGKTKYVYADPLVCHCLYIGSEKTYNQYKLHELQQKLANQEEMTPQAYYDSNWDWGAWGPPYFFHGPGW